jgi:hypothetical protein
VLRAHGFAPNRSKPVDKSPSNKKKRANSLLFALFFTLAFVQKGNSTPAKQVDALDGGAEPGARNFRHASVNAAPKRASVILMTGVSRTRIRAPVQGGEAPFATVDDTVKRGIAATAPVT